MVDFPLGRYRKVYIIMKNIASLGMIIGLSSLLGACAFGPVAGKPSGGAVIYSDVQFNERTEENTVGTKVGTGCTTNILGVYASGDASVANAAKSAGITKIASVDGKATNILTFYSTYCVVVTGE